MRLKEILKLPTESSGAVSLERLRRLELPMPEDVLEQFVHDHGCKGDFQNAYGDLDLHSLTWREVALPASDIIRCEAKSRHYSEAVEESSQDWTRGSYRAKDRRAWVEQGTWIRPPVFLGASERLHLVEGHTRVGRLKGCVESGRVATDSLHQVWLGSVGRTSSDTRRWRKVIESEKRPFTQWLLGTANYRDGLRQLEDVYDYKTMDGWGLDELRAFLRGKPDLKHLVADIRRYYREYQA